MYGANPATADGCFALEHHQSSDNRLPELALVTPSVRSFCGMMLPHEYVHSWNGKFRRPADQNVPNFNTPLQNSLLWVYEGQTQYWGDVLAARSGLIKQDHVRDILAATGRTPNTAGIGLDVSGVELDARGYRTHEFGDSVLIERPVATPCAYAAPRSNLKTATLASKLGNVRTTLPA